MSSSTTSEVVARAQAAVLDRSTELVDYLAELIRTPSDNPPGDCSAIGDLAEARCRTLSLDTERHQVDGGAAGPSLPVVLAWLGPRTHSPEIVLNAHLDASPPTAEWTVGGYAAERRDGRLYGRGATLSKSDVAGYTYALSAVREALDIEPAQTALLAITADEGSGGDNGPRWLLEQFGLTPRRAITAGLTHRVGIAHNGALQMRLTVRGTAAHQAVVPPEQEAMRHAVRLADKLFAADEELRLQSGTIGGISHPTLNVTKLCGGELLGLAPGTVELLIDRRVMPSEDTGEVLLALQALIRGQAEALGADVHVELVQRAEPLRPTAGSEQWARLVQQEAQTVLDEPVPLRGVPLYTDARWFGAHGVPTVLYGAGADDLVQTGVNGADENVAMADVTAAAQTVARVVARTLTVER